MTDSMPTPLDTTTPLAAFFTVSDNAKRSSQYAFSDPPVDRVIETLLGWNSMDMNEVREVAKEQGWDKEFHRAYKKVLSDMTKSVKEITRVIAKYEKPL